MKTFTDNQGRIWSVIVNVGAIKRVRALCGIDLMKIVEITDKNDVSTDVLEQLATDPVLLVDTLYAVCRPECEAKNVSDEDFGAALTGDVIETATNVLLDEIIDFFPEAKRQVLQKILAVTRRFEEKTKAQLKEILADNRIDQTVESHLAQWNGLSGSTQATAE